MQTSTKRTSGYGGKRPTSVATNLIAGGGAGMIEALVCYPLDTIKVRMQLSGQTPALTAQRKGIARTAIDIVRTEALLGLYRGLGAVLTGIVPKMALRFTSYEWAAVGESESNWKVDWQRELSRGPGCWGDGSSGGSVPDGSS
jgi:solute carrier family 25 citrate transporter 1